MHGRPSRPKPFVGKHGGVVPEFTPRFAVRELAEFCGLPEKRTKAALKELLDLGLVVEFSAERITFARSIDELTLSSSESSEFWEWSSRLTARKRLPLPRCILALACESSSPAQIALILRLHSAASISITGQGGSLTPAGSR